MSIDIRRVVCGLIQENCYIVQAEGRDDCVVVDPGDEYPKLKAAIGDRRVGAILLTHGHFDHIMAAGEMARDFCTPVYVGAEDAEMLNDITKSDYTGMLGLARADWPAIDAAPFGESLSVCGMDFTVLATPGHSRGSVCLYLKDEAVLFSGDTLFRAGYGRLDLYGGKMGAMLKSLKYLFTLPGEVAVYPGHGDATTIGEEKARYRI
ncbi:MAG: MBL fold metallo-hydrolase [Clostridia bacterium]|nr:MBL fold metallo-hydrolase [Clostridia bacterium]